MRTYFLKDEKNSISTFNDPRIAPAITIKLADSVPK